MEKPILATTLAGLFIKKEAWDKAHIDWYKEAAKKLNDASVIKWADKPDYFKGVDEVMQRLYPNLTEEKRTILARRMFFDSIIRYIQENPSTKNSDVIKYFNLLKKKYRLALITSNTKPALNKILSATNLSDLFDIIEASEETEKDDKIAVFNRFVKKYGKPIIYIGGDRKDSFDYCKKNDIPCIFANLEEGQHIEGVETINNFKGLKEKLENLS